MTIDLIDLPTDADIAVFVSPGFDVRYPRVVNRDRIPPEALASMEPAWRMGRYPERPVRVVRLQDVWVAKEGLVFDRDGALHWQTMTQHSETEIAAARAAVAAAIERGGPADRDGPVVLCKKRGVGNYGHWMMEMLPKAHLVHTRLPELGARFLVAAAPDPLAGSMAASLALLGIDPARVIVADDAPRRFAELVVVDGLTEHGAFMSPLVMDCADALALTVEASAEKALFVTRWATGFRRFEDEDPLLDRIHAAGWAQAEAGLLPLADQIALFKGADRIVGVMGAALTNIAFARPGARVVVFAPAGMPDTFFWFIAMLRGLDYTEIRCEQRGPVRGVMPWDTGLAFPEETWDEVFRL